MHSRPTLTCWKAEIVHSWPITVFAPISTSPSWARIFEPWPIQHQRPSLHARALADLERHAGADEAQPVGLQPPAPAQLQPRPADDQPRVAEGQQPVGAHEAQRARPDRRAAAPERRGPRLADPVRAGCPSGLIVFFAARWPTEKPSLAERLLAGDKRALARGISLVEDDDPEGWALVREVYPKTGNAAVVGFTGPPGAGKSTLIGSLVKLRRAADREVAVLSIDPSSPFRGGALLGDRIRLTEHFLDPGVFIRSMATRGALGGLAEAALQTALLMDAAGKDDVFLETVGVGQAEVDVIDHADSVVLVLIPGSGDSIQALKAGVMEIPDVIVVNKSDHPLTDTMVREIRGVLSLAPQGDWPVPIVKTEAHRGEGVELLQEKLAEHRAFVESEGLLAERRRRNLMNEVLGLATVRLRRALEASLHEDPEVQAAARRGRRPAAGSGERRQRDPRPRGGRGGRRRAAGPAGRGRVLGVRGSAAEAQQRAG